MADDKKKKGAQSEKAVRTAEARREFAKALEELSKHHKIFVENWRDFSNKATNPTNALRERFRHDINDFRWELKRIRRHLKHVKCP